MNPTNAPASTLQNGKTTRSLLACLPCRSRHLKCDGNRPSCTRCVKAAKHCQYAQSRRGGLDRAARAARRKRLAATEGSNVPVGYSSLQSPGRDASGHAIPSRLVGEAGGGLRTGDRVANVTSVPASPAAPEVHMGSNVENDPLIDSYYRDFHKFHPFAPPQWHLMRLRQDPSRQLCLKPLVAILRFIGNIYASREWSVRLKEDVDGFISQAPPANPFMVQCRVLYSVALFWYGYQDDAKREIDTAVQAALDLQMFRKEFATTYGAEDPVLTECWRRTWWTLYIVEAYFAGTLGTMTFTLFDVEATVDLPCEESEYRLGEIPEPRTLQEFDSRDLALEDTPFSSFAYLIGAVRCVALAVTAVPETAAKEDSAHIIQAADSIINGWLILLPKSRKQVMNKAGEIDELMFQAQMIVHVAFVGFHRPSSDLKFSPMEYISSCARDPPPDAPKPELINVHTVRVLRSVEAQVHLLALPVAQFHHTPFTTCLISTGVFALLSACHFLLNGKELAIARGQVRMIIGCLKELGEVWPRTVKNVVEIQTIALHVLGLSCEAPKTAGTRVSSQVPTLSSSQEQRSVGKETEVSSNDIDIFSSLGFMDGIWGWQDLDNLGPD